MPATERRRPFPASATDASLFGDSPRRSTRQTSTAPSWIDANCGNIFYRPPHHVERPSRALANRNPNLPLPLIGPRRNRPHSIHILTYPSGYVPKELRPGSGVSAFRRRSPLTASSGSGSSRRRSLKVKARQSSTVREAASRPRPSQSPTQSPTLSQDQNQRQRQRQTRTRDKSPIRPVLQKLLATISGRERETAPAVPRVQTEPPSPGPPAYSALPSPTTARNQQRHQHQHHWQRRREETQHQHHPGPQTTQHPSVDASVVPVDALGLRPPVNTPLAAAPTASAALDDVTTSAAHPPVPSPRNSTTTTTSRTHAAYHTHSDHHDIEACPLLSTLPSAVPTSTLTSSPSSSSFSRPHTPTPSSSTEPHDAMTGRIVAPPGAFPAPRAGPRPNSIRSVRSAKPTVSSLVTEVSKPVASGSGVSCSILLAEPNVFLSGFDHEGQVQHGPNGTALLRGKLQLNVSKNVKIKAVTLKLLGKARTEWPEGIPPLKADLFEEQTLRTQVLTFFNAMNEGWSGEYGNSCVYKLKNGSANSSTINLSSLNSSPNASSKHIPTAKDLKRLSLQNQQSRSFGKTEGSALPHAAQIKGYKVFYPGTYEYSFELPIDHHQLETIKLQYGSVKWELHANVERAGAFKPNLHGVKEVSIVRVPDQMSLETTEPISISRQWEDQLHYDIVISGKSFPIGSKIPVAFKLTPLAKVQVHKLKVYLTETIEYHTNDRKVVRKDPGRKILLLEKSAGKPLASNWETSDFRTVRGGELDDEQRREARGLAMERRAASARRHHADPAPLPAPSDNLLGDLDLGIESLWGSTEIEANVQLPTCEMMARDKSLRLHPDCSWKNVNVYHWIKIVMRISRLDPEDPTGTKRRHFEISIDSPFTVLNCRATQANTVLPAYSDPLAGPYISQPLCGCPDAHTVTTSGNSPNGSSNTLSSGGNASTDCLPAPPQAAHLGAGLHAANPASDANGVDSAPRPMHLLRAPSYNPPAFDDDTAPPALPELVTNPPAADGAAAYTGANEAPSLVTPPPLYDVVVGTPSVDGLADYFSRLADYRLDEDDEEDSDESDEGRMRIHRGGRVHVGHPPRRPGGYGRMPSRSLDLAR